MFVKRQFKKGYLVDSALLFLPFPICSINSLRAFYRTILSIILLIFQTSAITMYISLVHSASENADTVFIISDKHYH